MTEFDVADKIAKLLAKAETATPEEAESLSEKAEQLMVKHAIDQAAIDERRRGNKQKSEKIVTARVKVSGSFAKPMGSLAFDLAAAMGNWHAYLTPDGGRNQSGHISIVGFESDVPQVVALYQSLMIQATVAMRAWWLADPSHKLLAASPAWREKKAFLNGFNMGAAGRLKLVRETAERDSEPGTALVLVSRGERVKATLPKLKAGSSDRMGGSRDALVTGFRAGKQANTGGAAIRNDSHALEG